MPVMFQAFCLIHSHSHLQLQLQLHSRLYWVIAFLIFILLKTIFGLRIQLVSVVEIIKFIIFGFLFFQLSIIIWSIVTISQSDDFNPNWKVVHLFKILAPSRNKQLNLIILQALGYYLVSSVSYTSSLVCCCFAALKLVTAIKTFMLNPIRFVIHRCLTVEQ